MPDQVRTIEYFYVLVPNRPGEGARYLDALAAADVNLLAFSGFPEGRGAQLDFVPEDPAAFRKLARAQRWKVVGPKRGFLITGDDRVGVMAEKVRALAGAKINVVAVDAVCAGAGRYGALLWVAPRDVKRAAGILGAA
jgi:hypothetical protein